ncbi:hypothetical protein W97_02646 [Coniosporium apollinis CBS 100218]|uniref:AB hydrolase-1 domain-containing protein n=1 Tax=Coniosporium apollinis (strain CBS 100218) TaxID=1168221 RepID=R7YNM6_CONA1|nr:uncharacterized protein W97_02646 [Coniosporium apollinis CBS 100218]EON63419.1 hypothetical protein W97_02646 [Coniosporium apollinis CBS 100218]
MLSKYLLKGCGLLYGLFSYAAFLILAVKEGSIFRRTSEKAKKELSTARHKFWDLTENPYGLKHDFFILSSGVKLHYVTTGPPAGRPGQPTNLVIFLHGFPDSWVLWQNLLRSKRLAQNAVLAALDLPGYGGSDGLPQYDATTVLETITAFILCMREEYTGEAQGSPTERGKVIIVSHDWGAAIAFRLAAEAPQLADRFITSSVFLPTLLLANIQGRWNSAMQMLKSGAGQPRSLRLIRTAASTLSPVFTQLKKSGYVFIFLLPAPLANAFGSFGNYYVLRLLHQIAAKSKHPLEGTELAEAMAQSLGPSAEQCAGDGYSEHVRRRAPSGGWSEKIRYYREGAATGSWDKSIETVVSVSNLERAGGRRRSSSGAGLFEDGPRGALKAKVTFVVGLKDVAVDPTLAFEGIGDYFGRESQMVTLPEAGHWTPSEKEGAAVLEEVTAWALEGEHGTVRERLQKFPGAKVTVER